MLLPGGFRIPAFGCKTLAVRDCTFDLCKPRTSPPAWDISRQPAVCQSSKGVSPSLQRQQESSQSHGWGTGRSQSRSLLPRLCLLSTRLYLEYQLFVQILFRLCVFQDGKKEDDLFSNFPNLWVSQWKGPQITTCGVKRFRKSPVWSVLGEPFLSIHMDVIWGKKVERKEPKGGHRFLLEVMGML